MSQTILVTGAAGFIGSHLAEKLLARGDRVIAVDNFDPFYAESDKRANIAAALDSRDYALVEADIADLDALLEKTRGHDFDAIIHLAAKAGVRPSLADPYAYARTNVLGTQAVLELARARNVSRFVFGSSSSVYGNNEKVPFSESDPVERPISPYAATKRAGELACGTYAHLFGVRALALRFFTVYGPRQRPDLAIRKFGTRMLRGEPITLFGDGSSKRDYTWIDDILQGVVAALDLSERMDPGVEIINLGESRTTTLKQLVDLLADAVGVTPVIDWQPPQPGDVERTWADVTKAGKLLGYKPTTPVEEGIPRFAAWLTGHVASSSSRN